MIWPPFKVVLDTNVLFPPLLRDVLLRAADKGLYQPYWSPTILDELERVLVRAGHVAPDAARRARAEIARAFPEALIEGFEHLEPVMANDPGDRHVAAAATLAGAQVIVTANVRHFSGLPQSLDIQRRRNGLGTFVERSESAPLRPHRASAVSGAGIR